MKKFLIKIFFFCLISVIIYPIFIGSLGSYWLTQRRLTKNLIFNQGGNSFLWSKLQDADTTKNVDLLILGSSLANKGIDPRNFEKNGFRTFNLGSNAQTPQQTEYLLKKYLNKFNPKIVLWEVTPETFEYKGVESFIDICSNTEIDFDLFQLGVGYYSMIPLNTLLISGWRQYLGDFHEYKERIVKDGNTYIPGGYVETENHEYISESTIEEKNIEFVNFQISSFENSIKLLRLKGVKVILISAPTTNDYFSSIKNWKEINNYFQSFKNNEFIDNYINFNVIYPKFGERKSWFTDNMHLNKKGVYEYNKLLIKEIDF